MATFVAIDDNLLEEARKLGKHKTKRDAALAALREYIRVCAHAQKREVCGSFPHDPDSGYGTLELSKGEGAV